MSNVHYETQLPPMDGGMNAWLFLAACFVMEALVWGFAFTFGVFQAYYSDIPQFKDSGNIAVVGTCAMVKLNISCYNPTRANFYPQGIMYLDLPLVFAAYRQWPKYQRFGCALGVLLMCAALGLSSLATNTNHLIVTQGIFYALGGSIAYAPCILLMEEWFDRRKGLALVSCGPALESAVLFSLSSWNSCWASTGSGLPYVALQSCCLFSPHRWSTLSNRVCLSQITDPVRLPRISGSCLHPPLPSSSFAIL